MVSMKGYSWYPYSHSDRYDLKIENGTFVQYDREDGRRVPLEAIWEFNARRPDAGNKLFPSA
jgi:hypothetical protein